MTGPLASPASIRPSDQDGYLRARTSDVATRPHPRIRETTAQPDPATA
jgi:hypothetical protein